MKSRVRAPNSPKITGAYCTFPDENSAHTICERLLGEGLVACANISGPVHSIYRWKGQIQREQEWTAVLKTRIAKRRALMERLQALHPYENPALVFFSIEDGLPAFLRWVSVETL